MAFLTRAISTLTRMFSLLVRHFVREPKACIELLIVERRVALARTKVLEVEKNGRGSAGQPYTD